MTSIAEFSVHSKQQNQLINISSLVQKAIADSGVKEGMCVVLIPHTTAAITVNENADPDVPNDINLALSAISPDRREFRHGEGNSAAHTKVSMVGPSITLIISGGRLLLGTWQGIWFCEFDGPRTRRVLVRILGD